MNYLRAFTTLFLLILSCLSGQGCFAQQQPFQVHPMVNNDTVHVYNCYSSSGRVKIANQFFANNIDAWAIIDCNGQSISLNINQTAYYCDDPNAVHYVKIWDGDTNGTLLLEDTSISFNTTLYANSGQVTIQVYSRGYGVHFTDISILWGTGSTNSVCHTNYQSFRATKITSRSACIVWNSHGQGALVTVNGNTVISYGDTIFLNNLEPNTRYEAIARAFVDREQPCCEQTVVFLTDTEPLIGIPDFTNLDGAHVRGYYGNFGDPYQNIGIIENQVVNALNRHHVCSDTNEYDDQTGFQLRTVCPGMQRSVRLGNSLPHAQAESITYKLYIDTSYYALLMLRYAAVLQNPDHPASAQPRFTMEILDSTGHVIDPICGKADYHASSSLGWNSFQGTLWKDWTTVGFDMTPYHGQVVIVRFTTYDCSQGAHYGYAYFNAECRLNAATTEYCGGADSNTITAPDGFNYLWYFTNPSNVYSTNQTVHFSNQDALLHCRLISTENPSCYVTLNIYAGHRWPLAIIDTINTESLGCRGYRVNFVNRSTIINDDGDTLGGQCEDALWYFGDGFVGLTYSASHDYTEGGEYTVILRAGIAGNQCTDTAHFHITIPDVYVPFYYDTSACDSMLIEGRWYHNDTVGPTRLAHHHYDCDTLFIPELHILHSVHTEAPADTFCYLNTYTWHGQTVGAGNDTITQPARHRLVDHFTAANQCDSMVTVWLVQMPPPSLTIAHEPDCDHQKHILNAVTDLPFLQWSADPADNSIVGHESDDTVMVSPLGMTVYHLMADQTDSFPCPSLASVTLQPLAVPEPNLSVRPEMLTYDNLDLTAYDASHSEGTRHWQILLKPDTDTLSLVESGSIINYRPPHTDFDTLAVILTIENVNCRSTVQRDVPFGRLLFWAPNAFTPGLDQNNRFIIVTDGIMEAEIFIYDRQGRLVHTSTDLTTGWDGTRDGAPCPQGTYVWHLRYRAINYPETWQTTAGTVTLIR